VTKSAFSDERKVALLAAKFFVIFIAEGCPPGMQSLAHLRGGTAKKLSPLPPDCKSDSLACQLYNYLFYEKSSNVVCRSEFT